MDIKDGHQRLISTIDINVTPSHHHRQFSQRREHLVIKTYVEKFKFRAFSISLKVSYPKTVRKSGRTCIVPPQTLRVEWRWLYLTWSGHPWHSNIRHPTRRRHLGPTVRGTGGKSFEILFRMQPPRNRPIRSRVTYHRYKKLGLGLSGICIHCLFVFALSPGEPRELATSSPLSNRRLKRLGNSLRFSDISVKSLEGLSEVWEDRLSLRGMKGLGRLRGGSSKTMTEDSEEPILDDDDNPVNDTEWFEGAPVPDEYRHQDAPDTDEASQEREERESKRKKLEDENQQYRLQGWFPNHENVGVERAIGYGCYALQAGGVNVTGEKVFELVKAMGIQEEDIPLHLCVAYADFFKDKQRVQDIMYNRWRYDKDNSLIDSLATGCGGGKGGGAKEEKKQEEEKEASEEEEAEFDLFD
ncbi:hypothetical protein AAMO2058_000443400 [Amorphochlora amoebiformis]